MTDNILKDPLFQLMMNLSQNELDFLTEDAIKHNDNDKTKKIKYAYMQGNDLTAAMQMAIKMNDILSVAFCIKYGSNIHHTVCGNTYIHLCANEGHSILMESFINKKIDINKTNDDNKTALEIAMAYQHYNCVETLVKCNANLTFDIDYIDSDSSDIPIHSYDSNESDLSDESNISNESDDDIDADININANDCQVRHKKISLLELFLDIYNPKLKTLFELIVSKTEDISFVPNNRLFFSLKNHLVLKNYDCVEIILYKFPNIVNIVVQKHTLLHLLIELDQTSIVHRLISLDTTILNISGVKMPYLHSLCFVNDIKGILFILKKYPNSVNDCCSMGRTAIDYVLLNYSEKKEELCIETIKIINKFSGGLLLNHRNRLGSRTIETAIQFAGANIVDFLINSGCNINEPIIDRSVYQSSIVNNDPLTFASQCDKNDTIEILLKHKVSINLYDNETDKLYDGIPIPILSAIHCDSEKAITKLMSHNKISRICNDSIKQKILNFCVDNGTGNKEIMKYFINSENLARLSINTDTIIFNKLEKDLEQYFDKYQENKIEYLVALFNMITFLKYCSSPLSLDLKDNLVILTELYFRAISHDHFDILKMYVSRMYFKDCSSGNIDDCFKIIENIIDCDDVTFISSLWEMFIDIHKNHLCKMATRVVDLLNIITNKLSSGNILLDETTQYSIHSENNEQYIKKVLSPLMYPKKLKHYDEMYERISGVNCIISETSSYIMIKDNKTNIMSIIFNDGVNTPKKWFNFYNHNIGKDDKCDSNHIFPFALDKKLQNVKCYEKFTSDMVNKFGKIQLLYFSGLLICGKKRIMGFYEYFIDSTGSLFHRFFRPLDQLSDKTKEKLMCKFFLSVDNKYGLSKKLMKLQ